MTSASEREFEGTERFQILRHLGRGGMGVVYEAYDRERNNVVALKTLQVKNADALLRFKNEFRALQDVQHPNLVSLGELLEDKGHWFFTLELIDGVDLVSYVRSVPEARGITTSDSLDATVNVPVPAPSIVRAPTPTPAILERPSYDERKLRAVLEQLADGLYALHSAHKVHRDIKPSNVLCTRQGRVVILDFGLVTEEHDRAETDKMRGTVSYMAPEQAALEAVGPEADWYSVGTLLYLALTGRLPFSGRAEEILSAKRSIDPPSPRALCKDVPEDLAALCMELLHREPARRPTGHDVLKRLKLEDRVSLVLDADSVFVGRAEELGALREAYDETRQGRAVTVLIQGESGVGKTALLRAFLAGLRREVPDLVVLAGRCYERESVPYKAFDTVIDALSRHLARLPRDVVTPLLPGHVSLLAQVFPVLRSLDDTAPTPAAHEEVPDRQEQRARVFFALRELVGRLSEGWPLILQIDDLQWTDADSLALLAEILRPPAAPPILCLLTVRSASEPRGGHRSVLELTRQLPGYLRQLRLDKLAASEARELVERLSSGAPADRAVDVEAIVDEAQGHPLFIDALLRHRLSRAADKSPVRLDDALWARIERLDPPGRRLLEIVAVAGVPLAQETLAKTGELMPSSFAAAVATLRGAHLIRTGGTHRFDTIEPYHDRVREAVVWRLDQGIKRHWHGRLALVLKASGRADIELLAVHWLEAGDKRRAAKYFARAADRAAAALAFDHAARLYQTALEALESQEGGRALRLRVKLGDVLGNAGRGAEAARAYLAVAPLVPTADALELRRRASEQFLKSGHLDEGMETLREVAGALRIRVPKTPKGALASLLVRRVQIRLRGLGYRERAASEIPAGELARIDTLWSISSVLSWVDHIKGKDLGARHLLWALRAGEPYRIVRAYAVELGSRASTGSASGRRRATHLVHAIEELAQKVDQPHAHGLAVAARGMQAYLEGRWKSTCEYMPRAEQIFRERCTGTTWEISSTQLWYVNSLSYLGKLDIVEDRLPRWIREAEERGDRYAVANLKTGYANQLLWLARGASDELRREIREAMTGWSAQGFHVQHMYELTALCQADLCDGLGVAAQRRFMERAPALRRSLLLSVQVVRVAIGSLVGRLALAAAAEDPTQRAELLSRAERASRALAKENAEWAHAWAHFLSAGVCAQRGQADRAKVLLERAAGAFRDVDMELCAAATRLRLGRLVGGDEGRGLVEEAERWLREHNVAAPGRLAQTLAPGFGA
jgi:hypothetical protein